MRWLRPRLLVVVLTALVLSGCVLHSPDTPRLVGGPQSPPPTPVVVPVPTVDRDAQLSTLAACHLLRVGQANEMSVTDSTVIAATSQYGYPVETVIARANQLLQLYQSRGLALAARAVTACQHLAQDTGVVSALVRFEPDGQPRAVWLRIDGGEIGDGFAAQTIDELRRHRAIGLVINSPGGSVHEARELGRFLRVNGLRTAVDRACTSACVDILAGGVERYATPNAQLGIHQSKVPSRYSSHEGGQLYVADSFRYLREMDINADVAIAAASVPNNQILLISLPDALTTGLVTKVVEGFE